ncbi:MAG: protein TolQ [Rhodospirillaceae bacterium]
MEPQAAQAVEALALAGSSNLDFSVVALFLKADLVVKSVIVMLMAASVWCWTIIFEKLISVRSLNRRSDKFEDKFWSSESLDELHDSIGTRPSDPMSAVFAAAMRELRRSAAGGGGAATLGQRIERVMQITADREMDRAERYLTFLATTGNTAPFVGLFGTVWGIMSSFQSIAISKNTSLAVVAPGIAEALFATALGLLAAIPAVIAYNKFSRDLDRYAGRLENFSGEFSSILSRELDD